MVDLGYLMLICRAGGGASGACVGLAAGAGSAAGSATIYLLELAPFLVLLFWDRDGRRRGHHHRALGPGQGPGHARNILGPKSPFHRPAWQRFQEDTWPSWKSAAARFWASGLRWPVLLAVAAGLAWLGRASVRPYPAVSGQVVSAGAAPAAGAEVEILWYATREDVRLSKSMPFEGSSRESIAADISVEERAIATDRVTTGADGSFHFPGGKGVILPGRDGPFLRLRLRARDPLSGQPYRVRRFRLGDGTEVTGALDTARLVGSGDLATVLSKIELHPLGRIEEIAAAGDLVATAEGPAGVRLYRLAPGGAPVLLGHRLPPEGDVTRGVVFAGPYLLTFRNRGYDLVAAEAELRIEATREQRIDHAVAASAERVALLADGDLNLIKPAVPIPALDRVFLGDPGRSRSPEGFEYLRMRGSLLFYLHSDGTLRVSDLDSSFRTPATLTGPGGAVVGYDYLPGTGRDGAGALVVLASRSGATAYDVARPEATHRIGQVDLALRPLAVIGRAVIGERGVALLAVGAEKVEVEKVVDLACDEVEAASAWLADDEVVLPDVDDVSWSETRTEPRYDPVLNQTVEKVERRRESARLVGIRLIDLKTGELLSVELPDAPRVLLRRDGLNRSLLFAALADGRVVYARSDGTLLVSAW